MANLKSVIKISSEDYATLKGGGTITKGGVTYSYDADALYIIDETDPPAYAETAGVANTAVADTGGNNIAATYDKKPLVIEVDDTDTSVPQGTYASITAALATGRDVLLKVRTTQDDAQIEYMRIRQDYSSANSEYVFDSNWYWAELFETDEISIEHASADNHYHGYITPDGILESNDTTIANGDKLVITDASNSNRISRASLTFDGSTTTQALSKKGTWETFYKKPSTGIPASDLTSAAQTSLGKADTSVQKVTSTDNAIARFDGTGGQIQNSSAKVTDDGDVSARNIIIHGSNTSNDTRIITSDATNNIYAKIGGKIPLVANETEVRSGSSAAGTINLGTSTIPWNNVHAKKFITKDGTSSQVVLGDGSLKAANELSQYEAYLQWGGRNFIGGYGVADACMIPNLGSNKFAYGNPSGVTVEYSRDGGTTWQDYGLTDSQKRGLFVNAHTLNIGKADTNNPATTDYKLRIIIHTKAFGLYTVLNKFAFYVTNTTGNNHSFVTIDGRTQSDKEADNDVWTTFVDSQNINGWSAWNIINYPTGITTHGNRSAQYGDLRFTFFITDTPSGTTSSGLTIIKMMGYGGEGWTTPSYMAATGHLYAHDDEQNATFPANITATKFITKNGTSSQFVKGDGTLDSTAYAPKASPALTGTPTAPTAASGTNTTQVATTAFVQNALSNMGAGGSEMVDVTITGTTSAASFSANPYNAIKAVVDDGKIAVLNASVAPLSTTGVLIPVYEYTYSQSGSDFTGYKGKIQNGNYEISVDVQSTSSATVSITSVGSSITVDTALSESSTNPVQNRVITAQILENEEIVATALNNLNDRVELKQDQLVSGTTIKTINNQSILGSGNISISGGGGGGGGEENVIEVVKVNGTALTPDANKAVNVQALTGVTVGNTALTPSNGVITIGVDAAPTANSTNVVLSSGIKSYVDGRRVVYNISFGGEEVVIDDVTYYGIVNHALADAIIADVTAGKEVILADGDGGYNRLDSVLWGMYLFNTGGVKGYDFIVVSDTSSFQGYNILYRYATSYQERLVSGTNIKTVNNNSLLGSGNISVGTYSKPSGGIPATDLASAVQTSLGKADTALQPDVDNDLGQGTISSSNSQGFDYIIANKDTSSEQTLQDALDAKASISAVNAKYTKPSGGIPDTDLTTAVNVRLLAQLSSSSDDGKIMKYSYSAGSWQAVKPVTIYSGSSAPSSSTGSNGDIYIQTS